MQLWCLVLECVVRYRQRIAGNSPEGWDVQLPCRQLQSWKHICVSHKVLHQRHDIAISNSSLCPFVFGFAQDWSNSICLSLKRWSCCSCYRSSSKKRSRLLCHPPGLWKRKDHLNVPFRRRCWARNLVLCFIMMALRLRARWHIQYTVHMASIYVPSEAQTTWRPKCSKRALPSTLQSEYVAVMSHF